MESHRRAEAHARERADATRAAAYHQRRMRDIVILGTARTAIGGFQGVLADLPAPRLGGAALGAALARAEGVKPEQVGEVIMGNVLAAGLGQAPARQAAHHAGLPRSVGASAPAPIASGGSTGRDETRVADPPARASRRGARRAR